MRENNRLLRMTMLLCLLLSATVLYGLSIVAPYESDLVRVTVIGDQRGPLAQYPAYRHDKYWHGSTTSIEAQQGERYQIRVENRSDERLAMVISVDELNIISGKKSYLSPKESMYVLNPHQTGTFSGWRSGMGHVQRFYFTSAEDSYSARLGRDTQLGYIKVAVFREIRPVIFEPYKSGFAEEKMRSSSRKSMEDEAGTGYGETTWSPVQETEFNSESRPSQNVVIKYEWPDGRRYDSKSHHHDFAPPPED